ncbi:substrate-binding domain-containing protein [Fuchsiella alkaliacetigena]|uniref:substrate-binding domain-containing protein n=1 Tax=Fuchsiella alkaliacetigena TaxID=957042 RepID=UPI00200B653D|nr:substrate-binding domain-containing protein [Fuchsiella alkaliacetigena]MCK8825888.1 substrate-binding domain-containing protein [Fuchsiella alkaliacetigena]
MLKNNKALIIIMVILTFSLVIGRIGFDSIQNAFQRDGTERLILATTTSTENSGLLAELIPPFEVENDIRVDVIAVGTGKALELGKSGDADVLLAHAESAELEFMEQGYGVNREKIMDNSFVLVGPNKDPANIKRSPGAVAVFRELAAQEVTFISRGDSSGTNLRELELWEEADIEAKGSWYQETGQGMGSTLVVADEKQAYTLTDLGTYLTFKEQLDLEILLADDPLLFNPYSVLSVNPEIHADINYQGAKIFTEYLLSPTAQQIIQEYTIAEQRLFNPVKDL